MAIQIISGTTTKYLENSQNTVSFNLRQTPTVGNVLVAAVLSYQGLSPSITDNQTGNTYINQIGETVGSAMNVFLFTCIVNSASGTFTLTVTGIDPNNNLSGSVLVYEVAGLDTNNLVSGSAANTATSDASGTDLTSSLTNTKATSIFFATFGPEANGAVTVTAGQGFSFDPTNGVVLFSDGVSPRTALEYQIVNTIAPQQGYLNYTASFGNSIFNAVILCLNGFQQTPNVLESSAINTYTGYKDEVAIY